MDHLMALTRTPLLLERARPSLTYTPKSRTRKISGKKKLGPTRRDLYSRIERRLRDRATPQAREVARGIARIRYKRRQPEKPLLSGHLAPRTVLLKGRRL